MKRHALFVGVDRYADGHIPNLSCAVNDATDLHGFFKFGAGYDRVELLPNPAGRKEVLGMVRELTSDLGEGDFFLFFFAGHGFRVGENHVLVCEEDLYEDLKYEDDGLPLGQLKRRLSGAFDSALLLDACQSDILATRGGEGITERDISLIHEVSPVRVGGGTLTIVTSCDAGQTAAELSEGRHGLFTMAILDLLKEAQGAHTRLDLSDAFRMNLGRRMGEIATRYGLFTEQRPRFSCSGDSCFILLDGFGAASAAKVVAPLPSTVTGVSEGDVGSCVEKELDIVKKSNKLRGSIQFDMGYLSPEFVTEREDMECVLENPFILLFEENISNLWELLPLLQSVAKTGRPIVIIAGNVEGEALSTLVINKLRGTFQACAVKAPNDCGKEFFEDIAIFTNGKFISKDFGIRLESVSLELLGRAKKVIVAQDSTIIIGGSGNPEEVKAHVDYIRREVEKATFSDERHRFRERLSRLSCEEYGTAQRLYIQAVKHYRGKNFAKAFDFYQRAAKKGEMEAAYSLGGMYENGEGVEKNNERAKFWYCRAAELGSERAEHSIKKCEEAWIKDLKAKALQGDIDAQYYLGKRFYDGDGVERDYKEAFKWYSKAAENGHADAQCSVAEMYRRGKGVDDDDEEAARWYQMAFENGHPEAKDGLSAVYYSIAEEFYCDEDDGGDYEESVKWYFKAAELGHSDARYSLGFCYEKGCGVDQNHVEALTWYLKAAVQEHDDARDALQQLLFKMLGSEDEADEAKKWCSHVANEGNEDAIKIVDEIKAEIEEREDEGDEGEELVPSSNDRVKVVVKVVSSPKQTSGEISPQSLYEQAENYYHGQNGVMEDRAKAFELYKKASELGHAESQYSLGYMYAYGECTTKDEEKALFWYRKAAKQGHEKARRMVEGIESRRRPSWGFGSCSAPSPQSMSAKDACERGENYYYGRNGFAQNYIEAVKWYRKAADQGNAFAQYNLGFMYENGRGVTKKDDYEAVKWYRKAAEQGYAAAQCNLGVMYANGYGITKDDYEAVKWYCKSAEQGYARAQVYLGWRYENGRGVTQDDSEAVKWYRKAAEQGNASAQCNLGVMYDYGKGIKQDFFEAIKWYRKAADQGNASAQFAIGLMYDRGRGFQQNYEEAAIWYRKAISNGHEQAKEFLKVIEKRIAEGSAMR